MNGCTISLYALVGALALACGNLNNPAPKRLGDSKSSATKNDADSGASGDAGGSSSPDASSQEAMETDAEAPPPTAVDAGAEPIMDAARPQYLNPDAVTPVVNEPEPELTPLCEPPFDWQEPTTVALDLEFDELHSVTPDGRFWLVSTHQPATDAGLAGTMQVYDVELQTSVTLPTNELLTEFNGSLSADGLRVIQTVDNNRTLAGFQRDAEDKPFTDELEPFQPLNAVARQSGIFLYDPVYSFDRQRLYFRLGRSSLRTEQWVWQQDRWEQQRTLVDLDAYLAEYDSGADLPLRIAASSSDDLSLFFWDPNKGDAYVGNRTHPDVPFSGVEPLNLSGPVFPSMDCSQVYLLYQGKLAQSERR